MGRGGARTDTQSERRCIVTGRTDCPDRLIRFVLGPEGAAVPDLLGKLPGRGMWVAANIENFDPARLGKAFSRAARQKVEPDPQLPLQLEQLLADRCIHLLALARKAGAAIAGYEKVKSWLDTGEAEILLQASDGSERGKSKLRPPAGPQSLITVLSGTELGQAFGRENVIHGALAGGGLTRRVVEETTRLAGMRAPDRDIASPWKENTAS